MLLNTRVSVEEFEGQMKIVVQKFGYTESFANFAL